METQAVETTALLPYTRLEEHEQARLEMQALANRIDEVEREAQEGRAVQPGEQARLLAQMFSGRAVMVTDANLQLVIEACSATSFVPSLDLTLSRLSKDEDATSTTAGPGLV